MAAENLSHYGWDQNWADSYEDLVRERSPTDPRPARVVRHHGVAVDVATAAGPLSVPLRRGLATAPVVGDWVVLDGDTLAAVLPRQSLLERQSVRRGRRHPLVANLDRVLITCGLDRPLNAGRIQRSATVTAEAGAVPTVVLTKADLAPSDEVFHQLDRITQEHPGLEAFATSAVTGHGLGELRDRIRTGTTALLGESGSGKSSLINALHDREVTLTGEVRTRDRKGRHTTTTRELYPLPEGGVIVDTPGLRSLGLPQGTEGVETTFEDITSLAADCRFRDCAHNREPGCAVRAAVEKGELAADRLAAFHRLGEESSGAGDR